MQRRRFLAAAVATTLLVRAAAGQGTPRNAVVVLDGDALFGQSRFGRRALAEIEAASEALAQENRRIEAELAVEERALTARRAELPPAEFSALADAFDARVEGIRAEQDAKSRAIQQRSERAQTLFQERAAPVLAALAQEVGALVILDRRAVIAAADQADITDLALARLDEALGDGPDLSRPVAPARPGGGLAPPEADGAPGDR